MPDLTALLPMSVSPSEINFLPSSIRRGWENEDDGEEDTRELLTSDDGENDGVIAARY